MERFCPEFLVIGAAKSGTTAVDELLRQHPALWLPDAREPNHFAFCDTPPSLVDHRGRPAALVHTTVHDAAAYRALFDGAPPGALRGETSPAYLQVEGSVRRAVEARPDVRLVAILREPGARAFSAYQHLVREGREPLPFRAALAAEEERIAADWGLLWRYVDGGRYGEQLAAVRALVDPGQLLVLRHDDLARDAAATARRVFTFLGVEPDVPLDTSHRFNASGVPRNRVLHRVANPPAGLRRWVADVLPNSLVQRLRTAQASVATRNLERATPDAGDLDVVRAALAEDRTRLGSTTDLDLSTWPTPGS